jgi:parallel beta-helix repeat protein
MNQIMDRKISTTVLTVFYILVLTLVTLASVVPAHAAPKNVYYVDDDGGYDFTTIQAAIDACVSGDKIYVYAGEYIENLVIDVSITLTGEDPATTIIDSSGGGNCIFVDNVMVQIIGLTIMDGSTNGIRLDDSCAGSVITGNTLTGNGKDGIWMYGSDECTITGNTIENNGNYGIRMTNVCDDNEIIGNTITGSHWDNIYMNGDCDGNLVKGNEISYSETGQGIHLVSLCDDNEIIGNTITGNYLANIRMFSNCDGNLVKGNEISYSETGYGIWLYSSCDDNEIIGNTITGNYLANINLYQPNEGNLIQGNEISYSEMGQGINFYYLGSYTMIIGNEITDNAREGIRMNVAWYNVISRNHVLRNGDYGIDLENNDDYNTIENNIVLDNTTYDLYQASSSDYNTWTRNTYGTSSIN